MSTALNFVDFEFFCVAFYVVVVGCEKRFRPKGRSNE